jgi:choline dehydrogenase
VDGVESRHRHHSRARTATGGDTRSHRTFWHAAGRRFHDCDRALVQPTSRGVVRLASSNFLDAAVLDGNYLGTDRDFAAIVSAIEAAREIGHQRAFDGVRDAELMSGSNATAEEIRELARLGSASFGHPVGTRKMGMDDFAVVDPSLRVRGLLGLRVADASVMPRIITGPTNAPTHMVAGRAARLILGRDA